MWKRTLFSGQHLINQPRIGTDCKDGDGDHDGYVNDDDDVDVGDDHDDHYEDDDDDEPATVEWLGPDKSAPYWN